MRWPPGKLAFVVLLFISIGFLVASSLVGCHFYATYRKGQEERAWEEMGRSMKSFAERFPRTEPSPPALELERLAANMGIRLSPYEVSDRNLPETATAEAFEEVRAELDDYITAQATRDSEGWETPPETLADFLNRRAIALRDITELMLESENLVWDRDLSKGYESPIPSLVGFRSLQSLLILQCLEHARAGRPGEARRTLKASFKINAPFRESPVLMVQMFSVHVATTQWRILRHLETPSRDWIEFSPIGRYQEACLDAYQGDIWSTARLIESDSLKAVVARGGPLLRSRTRRSIVLTPYLRLCASNLSEAGRQAAMAVLEHKDDCRFDFSGAQRRISNSIAWWNPFGREWFVSVDVAWTDAVLLALEAELTLRVLEARPTLPASEPLTTDSKVCRDFRWTYGATPNGLAIFLSDAPFPWMTGKRREAHEPWRYSVRRRDDEGYAASSRVER